MKVFTPAVTRRTSRTRLMRMGFDEAGIPLRGMVPSMLRLPGEAFSTGLSNAVTSPGASLGGGWADRARGR